MANSYTREQLRSRQEFNATITAQAYTFTLENNAKQSAYFNIEGSKIGEGSSVVFKEIFKSGSIANLTNCSVVSGSREAAFIIDPLATASFTFTPVASIQASEYNFFAANTEATRLSNGAGTFNGVDLTITP